MSLLARPGRAASLWRCRQVSIAKRSLSHPGQAGHDTRGPKSLPFARYKPKDPSGFRSSNAWYASPWRKQAAKQRKQPKESPKTVGNVTDFGPSTTWICLPAAPSLLATLDDVLRGMYKLLEAEAAKGIIDLDAEWAGGDAPPPFLHELPEIQAALLTLSSHGRPRGWRLDVGNRSVVHHFLERSRRAPFYLNYKPVRFDPCYSPNPTIDAAQVEHGVIVSDSVVRVEHCSQNMTIDHLRHLFRRFELALDAPTIVRWDSKEYHFNTYLIRFADPSWARAAIREMQGKVVHERALSLSQFPRQMHGKVGGGEDNEAPAAWPHGPIPAAVV